MHGFLTLLSDGLLDLQFHILHFLYLLVVGALLGLPRLNRPVMTANDHLLIEHDAIFTRHLGHGNRALMLKQARRADH